MYLLGMSRAQVYVETTIPSFYHTTRSWNCQHLANANKFGHIRRVNSLFGLYVPVLATPLELLGEKP
jgi:hypothetical protein